MTSDTTPKIAIGGQLGQVAGRSNAGKSILHTIDPDFILGIGRISEFGARKYHMRNFLMTPGMAWSSVYESLLRHLLAYWDGEENDAESGLPHLLHAAWNLMCLYTYNRHEQYHPGDDRPSTTERQGRKWADVNAEFKAAQEAGIEGEVSLKEEVERFASRLRAKGYLGQIEFHNNTVTLKV